MPLVEDFFPSKVGWYEFPEEHRSLWVRFWDDHEGDLDKVCDFAEKAGIESPKEFYNALHWFLFDSFSGNPEILKKAAGKDFKSFVAQVLKNHINSPKDKNWYRKHNTTHEKFIAALEGVEETSTHDQSISYINARVHPMGSHLFHEWLLSQTKLRNEIVSVASKMNKRAYLIEKHSGRDPIKGLKYGSTVGHSLHPNKRYFVLATIKNGKDRVVVVRNDLGHRCFIPDVWNIVEA